MKKPDHAFLVKAKIFILHVIQLPVHHKTPDDQEDGDHKLKNHQSVAQSRVLESGADFAFEYVDRIECSEIECRIASRQETYKKCEDDNRTHHPGIEKGKNSK